MIDIKVYRVMTQIAVEVVLSGSEGTTFNRGTWYGTLDGPDIVPDLVGVISKALESIDREMGDVQHDVMGW